jgi:hypothetical protein
VQAVAELAPEAQKEPAGQMSPMEVEPVSVDKGDLIVDPP